MISLTPSLKDPCLYTGFVRDPSDPSSIMSSTLLSLSMYVDDFIYFSKDPAVEALICRLLAKQCKVDFMGIVEWFLDVHFSWRITPSLVAIHLNQSGFATNLVKSLLANPDMRHPRQHCIVLAFRSIPLHPPPMWMTLLRRYVERRHIRALLAASVGCRLLHVLTSLRHTPSYHLTLINLHLGT